MNLRSAVLFPYWGVKSIAALRYARRKGIPGLAFDRFGRRQAARLLPAFGREALRMWLNPLALVRYFEFEFTASTIPDGVRSCLDVSSPRLFSLWLASSRPSASVLMINPDPEDLAMTDRIIRGTDVKNVRTECEGVDALEGREAEWDFVYSISVIEHIAGAYDDRRAIELLWASVRPGGTLALTFPVDRRFRDEYRSVDHYGTQQQTKSDEGYFFARHYDLPAIRDRLLRSIGDPPFEARFFGERVPGTFDAYEKRWMKVGFEVTIADPREIADHYAYFASWDEMPGWGVCGLKIEKPG